MLSFRLYFRMLSSWDVSTRDHEPCSRSSTSSTSPRASPATPRAVPASTTHPHREGDDNNHYYSLNRHQTSINRPSSSPTSVDITIEPSTPSFTFCITSSTRLKQHPRRRAAAASRRCCIINHEGFELETPTTTSINISSTSRDPLPSRQRRHPRRDLAAFRQCSRIPQANG